jgi:hypothetical protein
MVAERPPYMLCGHRPSEKYLEIDRFPGELRNGQVLMRYLLFRWRISLAAQLVFGGLNGRLVTGAVEPVVIHGAFILRIPKGIFGL